MVFHDSWIDNINFECKLSVDTDYNIFIFEEKNSTFENNLPISGTDNNVFLPEQKDLTTKNLNSEEFDISIYLRDEPDNEANNNIFLLEGENFLTDNNIPILGTNTHISVPEEQNIPNTSVPEERNIPEEQNIPNILVSEDRNIPNILVQEERNFRNENNILISVTDTNNFTIEEAWNDTEINDSIFSDDFAFEGLEELFKDHGAVGELKVSEGDAIVESEGRISHDNSDNVEEYKGSHISPQTNPAATETGEGEGEEEEEYYEDGYHWRKYGQKQVKGGGYPRSYYKCTNPGCKAKKKVQTSPNGGNLEIIYMSELHNHPKPPPNPTALIQHNGTQLDSSGGQGDGSSGRQRKRKMIEEHEIIRTVSATSVIIEVITETADILNDGYRWRKYGQKVVKGNHNPRSYYKCTTPKCMVRKHIERSGTNNKAVLTSYQGRHNHEKPPARNTGGPSSSKSVVPSRCQNDMARVGLNSLPTLGPPPPHNFTYEMNQHMLDNVPMAPVPLIPYPMPPPPIGNGMDGGGMMMLRNAEQNMGPYPMLPPSIGNGMDGGGMMMVQNMGSYLMSPPSIGNDMNGSGMMMVPNVEQNVGHYPMPPPPIGNDMDGGDMMMLQNVQQDMGHYLIPHYNIQQINDMSFQSVDEKSFHKYQMNDMQFQPADEKSFHQYQMNDIQFQPANVNSFHHRFHFGG